MARPEKGTFAADKCGWRGTGSVWGPAGSVSPDVQVRPGSLPGSLFHLLSFGLLHTPGSGGAKSFETVQSLAELAVETHFVFVPVGFEFAESKRVGRGGWSGFRDFLGAQERYEGLKARARFAFNE